jgi:hypothetical protein
VGGLVLFSIPGHQRADLLLPLFPAACVLVGRAFAERTSWISASVLRGVATACIFAGLGGVAVWNHVLRLNDRDVQISQHAETLAGAMQGLKLAFSADAAELEYAFRIKRGAVPLDAALSQLQDGTLDACVIRGEANVIRLDDSLRVDDLGWGWNALRRADSAPIRVPTAGSSPAVGDLPP